MLVSLCAVCASSSVKAADSGSTNTQASPSFVGAGVAGDPAVVLQPDHNRWAMFVKGSDGACWWSWSVGSGQWTAWKSIGGDLSGSPGPTVISKATGYLEVYVRGTDGGVWQKFSTDWGANWYGWYRLPEGSIASGTHPSASYRPGTTTVDVFVTGTDHHLYYRTWANGWSGWKSPSNVGYVDTSPAAFSKTSNTLEVYVRGSDGVLYQIYSNPGVTAWTPWFGLKGVVIAPGSSPAASYRSGTSTVDVSVRGTDNNLWLRTWAGGWSGWMGCSPPGVLSSSPSQFSLGVDNIEFYVRGSDMNIWYTYKWDYGWGHTWMYVSGGPS